MNQAPVKICAVIVTYNRKEYLSKLLDALFDQTLLLDGIYILDNHGNDGTDKMLKKIGFLSEYKEEVLSCKIYRGCACFYYRNHENTGGSGGFSKVVQLAMEKDWDYVWIMDDDVFPEADCLANLLYNVTEDARVCIPTRTDEKFIDRAHLKYNLWWPFYLKRASLYRSVRSSDIKGDYAFVQAFPFEGPFISSEIIREIGYPDSQYFLFYDDTDYARRILKVTKIKYVKNAVLHKQIIKRPVDYPWRNYYLMRNCFAMDKFHGENRLVRYLRPWLMYVSHYVYFTLQGKNIMARVTRKAYLDAKMGKMGETVIPGKLEEYLDK